MLGKAVISLVSEPHFKRGVQRTPGVSLQLLVAKFTYDDVVNVRRTAKTDLRPGARAWVIAVFDSRESRPGSSFDRFPEGTVYTVEFEDGAAIDLHESDLEPDEQPQ
jgi:hypothetical protein